MTDRLFVAVPLPGPVRDTLDAYVAPRREADPALRWVGADNWHVTLAFLGAVPPGRHDALVDELAAAAARTRPFALGLAGAGAFPHAGAARVLWLAADPGGAELGALARRVRQGCSRVGVPPDGRKFTAHVTLARARVPVRVDRWLTILDAIPPITWLASGFTLFDSTLNRGGSIYRPLTEFTLPASPRPSSGIPAEPDPPRLP